MKKSTQFKKLQKEDLFFIIYIILIITFIFFQPIFGISVYYIGFISNIIIFSIISLSFMFLYSYTGLLSMSTSAFYMVGAYSGIFAIKYLNNVFSVGLLSSLSATALFAFIVGSVANRVKGVYFMLITLGFSMFPYLLSRGPLKGLTRGQSGMHLRKLPAFIIDLENPHLFLFFIVILLIGIYLCLRLLPHTHFGKVLFSIKENELKMRSLGYNTWWIKTMAVIINGILAGLAGYLFLLKNLSISPVMGTYFISAKAVFCTFIGGLFSVLGPIIGSLCWYLIEEFLVFPGFLEIVLGIGLIMVILFFPQGIIGALIANRMVGKREKV